MPHIPFLSLLFFFSLFSFVDLLLYILLAIIACLFFTLFCLIWKRSGNRDRVAAKKGNRKGSKGNSKGSKGSEDPVALDMVVTDTPSTNAALSGLPEPSSNADGLVAPTCKQRKRKEKKGKERKGKEKKGNGKTIE